MRIAIVVQRYGPEVPGGSETAARWLAERLAQRVRADVLTTCAVDYTTWENVYPAGITHHNGVRLHRFPVTEPRDWQRAQKETGRFLLRQRTLDEELAWVRRSGPFAPALLQTLQHTAGDYDAFVFFTYLYATTCLGLPLVADKAVLVPTAHDEPFLYMEIFRRLCHLPRHLVYLTDAERALVQRITGNSHLPYDVAAVGVNRPPEASAARFRQKYGLEGDFLLYGGRISESKNVPELLDYFQRYRRESGRALTLVLMGQPTIDIPPTPGVLPIGFVSEQEKADALSAATLFVLPSLFESLSIVLLESWLLGRPVLVNGRCEVTKQQCRLSNGGLYYVSYDEFAAALDRLLDSPALRTQLGNQGRRFVAGRYTWDNVLDRYEGIFARLARPV